MKKLRANMDTYFGRLDENWRALPLRRQRRYARYFFAAYLTLTAGAIFEAWHETTKPGDAMVIEHIESPVFTGEIPAIVQDTIPTILNENIYERK